MKTTNKIIAITLLTFSVVQFSFAGNHENAAKSANSTAPATNAYMLNSVEQDMTTLDQHFSVTLQQDATVEIWIYRADGKHLFTQTFNGTSGVNDFVLNLDHKGTGNFIAYISINDAAQSFHFYNLSK